MRENTLNEPATSQLDTEQGTEQSANQRRRFLKQAPIFLLLLDD